MIPTMDISPLYIPKNKRWKGLVVFCNKCKTNMYEKCGKTGKSLKQCPNADCHVFKVYVSIPGTKNKRKTKKLETRDLNEAIKQAIEFEKEVKNYSLHDVSDLIDKQENKVNANSNRPELLIHVNARFISWLNNEGVPEQSIEQRSEEHIKDMIRALNALEDCLIEKGFNLTVFSIDHLNNNVVGIVYSYLKEKGFSNRTFNKYVGYYKFLLKWYTKEYNYTIRSWFDSIKKKSLNPTPEAITQNEFKVLLKQITTDNGIKEYEHGKKKNRNYYRVWLKDGFRLALETGRRREEIITLKWNNIVDNKENQYIKTEDYKVNRIKNRIEESEKKYIYIPIINSLRKLLNEMEYEKYKNTDRYILAPELNYNRNRAMSDILSRGFTHYYNQLGTDRKLTFKCLRKTYITNLQIFMGGQNVNTITGHSGSQVIENNYIDKKEIAKSVLNFNVFSKEVERNEELEEIRSESEMESKNINLEV